MRSCGAANPAVSVAAPAEQSERRNPTWSTDSVAMVKSTDSVMQQGQKMDIKVEGLDYPPGFTPRPPRRNEGAATSASAAAVSSGGDQKNRRYPTVLGSADEETMVVSGRPSAEAHGSDALSGGSSAFKTIGGAVRVTLHCDGSLEPSEECAKICTNIFKKRSDPDGWAWKKLSNHTKQFYWEEFEKRCVWDPTITSLVRVGWEKKARKRYSDYVNKLKKKSCPIWIPSDTWTRWRHYWDSSEATNLSSQQSANRRGGNIKNEAAATHRAGSICYDTIRARMKEQLGYEPTDIEIFLATGSKTDDEGRLIFINDKSRMTMERMDEIREHLATMGTPYNDNEIYLKAAGGIDKKHKTVRGHGSAGMTSTSGSVSQTGTYCSAQCQSALEKMKEYIEEARQQNEQQLAVALEQIGKVQLELQIELQNLRSGSL